MTRPIQARIHMDALAHNYSVAKQLAPRSQALAVIKADGYGHGYARVVRALPHADGFAMLNLENAIALRESGEIRPLMMLEGFFDREELLACAEHDIWTSVHSEHQLALLESTPLPRPVRVWLKLNTGMNRLGFTAADLPAALARLRERPQIAVTLMTHFAEADGERGVTEQLQRFETMRGDWSGPVTLANSAAILRHPQTHRDWVRPGIMLYGASPFAEISAESLGLQPAMTLESRLIGIQTLAAGDRVGYGGTFVAERPMRIGIVACGYADGYPRHAPTGTPIAVAGQRTRTLGRVSMDMLACDITDIPDAGIDAPVTLWGPGIAGTVPADDVATAAGTIAYELFCALATRVPVTVDAK